MSAERSGGRPSKRDLPAPDVRGFRGALDEALAATRPGDTQPISNTTWGVYAFYDFEGEPIYVGQTNESLRVRIRRHLTNQRTDAVGMRVLDPFEILDVELWPLFDLEGRAATDHDARHHLNRLERTVYERAIAASHYGVILNEKIPPEVPLLDDGELPAPFRFRVVPDDVFAERAHPDNRIARRAETLSRLAAVVRERGEVSDGLRRVLVVQSIRLAWLGAQRVAYVEGRPAPDYAAVVDLDGLVGSASAPDAPEEEVVGDDVVDGGDDGDGSEAAPSNARPTLWD